VAYCVSAFAGGIMLYRWWRMKIEGRRRVWWLYGWFCALMLCGSCFGVVMVSAKIVNLASAFKGNDAFLNGDFVRGSSLFSLSYSWLAVFTVTYALEFLCLSAAKLMVLDRMTNFAAGQDDSAKRRWTAGGRIVMAVVVLGNVVGFAANISSAVHAQKAAEASSTASTLFAANNTYDGRELLIFTQMEIQLALSSSSVQSFSEVVVLLLIIAAFLVTGVFCIRRVSSGMFGVNAAAEDAAMSNTIRLQIVGTTTSVFVAFVLRSVVSTMFAVANQLQNSGNICSGVSSRCDTLCYNMFTHLLQWMNYTPEFQQTTVLISSPLALLVALLGMTSRHTLQTMKSSNRTMPSAVQPMLTIRER
jgi:hypothetical protein